MYGAKQLRGKGGGGFHLKKHMVPPTWCMSLCDDGTHSKSNSSIERLWNKRPVKIQGFFFQITICLITCQHFGGNSVVKRYRCIKDRVPVDLKWKWVLWKCCSRSCTVSTQYFEGGKYNKTKEKQKKRHLNSSTFFLWVPWVSRGLGSSFLVVTPLIIPDFLFRC